jgi:hypothetical protein
MPTHAQYTREDARKALREMARRLNLPSGQAPTIDPYRQLSPEIDGAPSGAIITDVLYSSYREAIFDAGLAVPAVRRDYTRSWTREKMLDAVWRAAARNGGRITAVAYDRLRAAGDPSCAIIRRRLGRWRHICAEAGVSAG